VAVTLNVTLSCMHLVALAGCPVLAMAVRGSMFMVWLWVSVAEQLVLGLFTFVRV
jgi:hypothetical protein